MKTPGEIFYTAALALFSHGGAKTWSAVDSERRAAYEAGAQAVLASQWRSVSEPPDEQYDAIYIVTEGGEGRFTARWRDRGQSATYYMPVPPLPKPPEPTPEERERSEFEATWSEQGMAWNSNMKEQAFGIWKAARKGRATLGVSLEGVR